MKKGILASFLILSLCSAAQGLNAELGFNSHFQQQVEAIVCTDEYAFKIEQTSSFSTSLSKIDTSGIVQWSKPLFTSHQAYEIVATSDGGVVVLGVEMSCDVISDCVWKILKVDSDGNETILKTWIDPSCYETKLSGLTINEDQTLCFNSVENSISLIQHVDPLISPITTVITTRQQLKQVTKTTANTFVAYKDDSLFVIDYTGNALFTRTFSHPIESIRAMNDTIFVLTDDNLYSLSASLQPIDSIVSSTSAHFSKLKVSENQVQFIGTSNGAYQVFTYNKSLDLVSQLAIPLQYAVHHKKDFSKTHIAFVYDFPLTLYSGVRFLDYSLQSTENALINSTDIGIIDIQNENIEVTANNLYPNVLTVTISGQVLVKNDGNHWLNSCRINHFNSFAIACDDHVFSQEFEDLNLAPGDSMWIDLGQYHFNTNNYTTDSVKLVNCVYTSFPNKQTDLTVSNDSFCETIYLGQLQTSTVPEKQPFSVFPNPANEELKIETEIHNYTTIRIIDLQGKTLLELPFTDDLIRISQLTAGFYFLQLATEFDASTTIKFQKVD